MQGDAERDDLLGSAEQRGAGCFVASVAERHEQLQPPHALDVLALDIAEALEQFLGGDQFGRLGLERGGDCGAQAQQPLGEAVRAAEQPLDGREVEAVGLQVEDQPQSRDVLGAVVADPGPDLRRGKQPARVVVADVAHRHADLRGELLDRQVVCLLIRREIAAAVAVAVAAAVDSVRLLGRVLAIADFRVTLARMRVPPFMCPRLR